MYDQNNVSCIETFNKGDTGVTSAITLKININKKNNGNDNCTLLEVASL